MNKIDTKEILAVTFFTCTALYPGFGINSVLNTGNTTSVIALIVAFIIGIIPLFAIIYLNKKIRPKRDVPVGREEGCSLGAKKNCSILTEERILQCLNYLKILQKKIIYLF